MKDHFIVSQMSRVGSLFHLSYRLTMIATTIGSHRMAVEIHGRNPKNLYRELHFIYETLKNEQRSQVARPHQRRSTYRLLVKSNLADLAHRDITVTRIPIDSLTPLLNEP